MEKKSIYQSWFGLEHVITPGFPWNSQVGGGYLAEEVMEAMKEAAKHKVSMHELSDRAGRLVAEIIGCEAAFITCSDCAAMALSAAAMMTGKDEKKMDQLPNTEHPARLKNELIAQIGMFEQYMRSFTVSGAKLVRVGGKDFAQDADYDPVAKKRVTRSFRISPVEIEEAINERTAGIVAAVHCSNSLPPPVTLPVSEVVKVARKHNLPTVVDSPHPPVVGGQTGVAFLRKYIDMGVDLVCLSGGKAIDAPNSTGLIYGKKDLVEAASLHGCPGKAEIKRFKDLHSWQEIETHAFGRTPFGRGFKVSRELMVGFVAALKRYVSMDSQAVMERDARVCKYLAEQLRNAPCVRSVELAPECDWPNDNMWEGGVSVVIEIDEKALGITIKDISDLMWQGDPHIDITRSSPARAPVKK
ncbi:MAG: aminotransferase class V-fold PLP-dependent enzyme [Acidobacteriota bacterium]